MRGRSAGTHQLNTKIGMVAPSAHHNGRTKSAPRPKTVKVSQNIFRFMHQVYVVFGLAIQSRVPETSVSVDVQIARWPINRLIFLRLSAQGEIREIVPPKSKITPDWPISPYGGRRPPTESRFGSAGVA